jgi:hypothetical protein
MNFDKCIKDYKELYEIKIYGANSQNKNYKPVKADLFKKFYEGLTKDKEPQLTIIAMQNNNTASANRTILTKIKPFQK